MKKNILSKLLRRIATYYLQIRPQKHYRLTIKNLLILKIFSLKNNIFTTYFNTHNDLNSLCEKYHSKKHNYLDFMEFYFHSKHQRNAVENILEVGIGTNFLDVPSTMGEDAIPGASLRMWRDFFPNSIIYGVDIDERILFQEDRIFTDKVDQNSVEEIENFKKKFRLKQNSFQLIIDDGHHIFPHNLTFFENTIELLSSDGLYIIEDVNDSTYFNFMKYFENKSDTYFVMTSTFLNPTSKIGARMIMVQKKF